MLSTSSMQVQKDQLLETFFLNFGIASKKLETLHSQHQNNSETEDCLIKPINIVQSNNYANTKESVEEQNRQTLETSSQFQRITAKFPSLQPSNSTTLSKTLGSTLASNYQFLNTATSFLTANEKRSIAREKPQTSFSRDRIQKMQTLMMQNQVLITPTDLTMKATPTRQLASQSTSRTKLEQFSPFRKLKHRQVERETITPLLPTLKQLDAALCGVRIQIIKSSVDAEIFEGKFTKLYKSLNRNLNDADNLFNFLCIERRMKTAKQIIKENFVVLLERIYKFFMNQTFCRIPRPNQLYFQGDSLGYDCSFIIFSAALTLILEDFEPVWIENAFFPAFIRGTEKFGPYMVNG